MSELDTGVKRHFDEMAEHYYNVVAATPFYYGYYHAKEVSFVRKVLRDFATDTRHPGPPPTILDIGCATGAVIRNIRSTAPDAVFVGLDLSPGMMKFAKVKKDPNLELVVGDIRQLPFQKQAFDFVYSLEVIEHLSDKLVNIPLAVNEVMRVTRTSGYATLESPSTYHFQLQDVLKRTFPGMHVSLYHEHRSLSDIYRNVAPLPVAGPSPFGFVSSLIGHHGGAIKAICWVRVIPEQAFVLLRSNLARKLLLFLDELLARTPIFQRIGREFLICATKKEGN